MGLFQSLCGAKGRRRVYLSDEDELREKVEAFAVAEGCPVERLPEVMGAFGIDGEAPDLDPTSTGYVSVDAVLAWLRCRGDEQSPEKADPAAGLKDDGDLGGSGLEWDVPRDESSPTGSADEGP
mmetsp:Transcript_12716/g.41627  ORF Transcript_12716/g.41627 Transcript_12716/m.41627 type:complete len:124 (+) Transcript_12716:58-429(+)